jgi:hypothetical protein
MNDFAPLNTTIVMTLNRRGARQPRQGRWRVEQRQTASRITQTNAEDRALHELDGFKPSSGDTDDGRSTDLGEPYGNRLSGLARRQNLTALSRQVEIWPDFFRRQTAVVTALRRRAGRRPDTAGRLRPEVKT